MGISSLFKTRKHLGRGGSLDVFPRQQQDPSQIARGPEVSNIPRHFGEGKHRVDLAYITPEEADLLSSLDMHGTTPPNTGPEIQNIPNYNGWGDRDSFGSTADTDASNDPSNSPSGGGYQSGNNASGPTSGPTTSPTGGPFGGIGNGPPGSITSPPGGEEEDKPGFFQGVFDWFSGLAPTPEESFENNWNSLASWDKKKMLDKLDFDPENMTAEALDAFDKASNMSWADIKEFTSNISMEDFTGLPGSIGAAFNMFDAINPFTNTQYNLQDPNNWTGAHPSNNMVGTYTGNIASLNSSQLNDLATMQGGLNQTQLGQALAEQMREQEEREATRGNVDRMRMDTGTSDTVTGSYGDNGVTIENSNEYKDLIARGFSDAYARNVITSGNYFASYD